MLPGNPRYRSESYIFKEIRSEAEIVVRCCWFVADEAKRPGSVSRRLCVSAVDLLPGAEKTPVASHYNRHLSCIDEECVAGS